jgi:hypothetical protein
MFTWRTLISVLVLQASLGSFVTAKPAYGDTSKKKKAVTPASANKRDVTVRLTNNYCDTALPYEFTDDPQAPSLSFYGKPSNATMEAIQKLKPPDKTVITEELPKDVLVDSPPVSKSPLRLIDPGGPILGDVNLELGPDGYDAMRLLVRTLYPSLAANACNPNVNASDANSANGLISAKPNSASKPFSFSDAKYYLIDVVRWETVSNTGQTMSQIAADHWYLLNYSDAKAAHREFPFTFHSIVTNSLRIHGESNVVFIAIHLAPNGDSPSGTAKDDPTSSKYQPSWFDTVDISYNLEAQKVQPLNWQDLSQLVNLVTGITIPEHAPGAVIKAGPVFQGRYGAVLLTNLTNLPAQLTSTMTVKFNTALPNKPPAVGSYCVAVTKNLIRSDGKDSSKDCSGATHSNGPVTKPAPAPDNPQSSNLGRLFGRNAHSFFEPVVWQQNQEKPASKNGSSSGGSTNTQGGGTQNAKGTDNGTNTTQKTAQGSSCDVTTSTKEKTQSTCTATQTIQDEGLYHWDISIAVPIPGYKDVSFSSAGNTNTLTAQSITRTDAYAMLDIAPWGEDFRNSPIFGIPHFMTGLPLSAKTFDKPFVAGLGENVGLSKILPFSARVFVGLVYDKEQVPVKAGSTTLVGHRVWKCAYGIEFSISSVISKLKGNGGGTQATNKTAG